MLLEETPQELAKLQQLYADQKWNALGATAHKFKSSAVLFGIKGLAADLKTIELNARAGKNIDTIGTLLDKVAKTCTLACEELKKEREYWNT
jgi:HPt (histidine-containing phosphotransfer) domain-containing protein